MSSSTINPTISTILAKPTKTYGDLQQIIDIWHEDLSKNEANLLQYARQLNDKQQLLNKTTESFIQTQDLLGSLEGDLDKFQTSIQSLTNYNDELEQNIGELNTESKTLLPNILSNVKTEQDRTKTYELMESVDNHLSELEQTIQQLQQTLQINTDHSIIKTTEDLQTCFQDINTIQDSIKQIQL